MRLVQRSWLSILVAATAAAGCDRSGADSPAALQLRALLAQTQDSTVALTFATGDTFTISSGTLAFYRKAGYRPVWTAGDLERARVLHATIGLAEEDGLDPTRYGYNVGARLIHALDADGERAPADSLRARYEAYLDVVLSEGFNRYVHDLVHGAVDPDSVGDAWRIPRLDAPYAGVLELVADDVEPAAIVHRMRPAIPQYRALMGAYARLRTARDAGGWQQIAWTDGVAPGDSAAAVQSLRARLIASDDPREANLARAGAARAAIYDRDLRDAVRHFQQRHGIDDDGAIGDATLAELNRSIDDRIAEVRLNLDRWRWLPHELGPLFVLVNIAGFELSVIENGRSIESMNVVVGMEGWNTPVFADTMEQLILNPSWTPPPSILEEEILPAIAADPGYLERNGFVRTANGGVRQKPGADNALGRYKFVFPNPDNIYLHDTPAGHLFSRSRRDFSHGCIRIERPADLARLVAERATEVSQDEIEKILESGSERAIDLTRPIPIYILYFTAWATEDGTLRFHHDVYGHDEAIEGEAEKLRGRNGAEAVRQ